MTENTELRPIEELTFREAMAELDGIVGVLESNSLELEDSLRSYERGVALLAALQGRLAEAQQKVDVLMGELVADADEQHEVAHRESVRVRPEVDGEQRRGHMHEERREAQEDDAHGERARQAELSADVLLVLGQAVRGDRDEHQVVHAEHDFQEDEADQADPCLG